MPNQSISLKANPNYWGGHVNLGSVEMRFITDGATRSTQLQAGEAQIARDLPPANLSTLKGDRSIVIDEQTNPRTTVMLLNNSRPPFNNELVRKAVQAAVNTKAIVEAVFEGLGQPAVGPFPPGSPWTPAGARVCEHRKPRQGQGALPAGRGRSLQADDPAAQLHRTLSVRRCCSGHPGPAQKLGITVKIKSADYASLEPAMLSGNFDATLLSRGYLIYVADPGGYLQSDFTCDGGYNIAHYCDPETDQMIKDAVSTKDQTARNQKYAEIAKRLEDQAASVWLLHEASAWGISSKVQNFKRHPLDYYTLTKDLSLSN